jgi:hypothetical protein
MATNNTAAELLDDQKVPEQANKSPSKNGIILAAVMSAALLSSTAQAQDVMANSEANVSQIPITTVSNPQENIDNNTNLQTKFQNIQDQIDYLDNK